MARNAVRMARNAVRMARNAYICIDKYNLGYNAAHYVDPNLETTNYVMDKGAHHVILSALLYSVGYDRYGEQLDILASMSGKNHVKQAAIIKQAGRRFPKCVIDIGGGRGELAAIMQEVCGSDVTVLDPSAGSAETTARTAETWFGRPIRHVRRPAGDIWRISQGKRPDCIILCESIEHISRQELDVVINGICGPCRMVIVNHIDFWPIRKHAWPAWNHVRTVDESVYDELCSKADHVVFRRGSHLILEFI